MAEVAHVLHFALDDLWSMEVDELVLWHAQAVRIASAERGE
jgi:hypothetical protein